MENLETTAVLVDPEQMPTDVVTMNSTMECTVVGIANTYHCAQRCKRSTRTKNA